MKTKATVFNLFFFGIFISTIIYSPLVLDFTLTPRLIAASCILAVCFYLLYKDNKQKGSSIDLVSLFYLAYFIFSCLSFCWANTSSEAVFDNARLFIAVSVFFISYRLYKHNKDGALNLLCKLSIVLVLAELLIVLYHLSLLKSLQKEELYSVTGLNSHKNLLSSFLYLQLLFLIVGIVKLTKAWKYASVAALLVTLGIIALIQTKAVWIGVIISVFIYGALLLYKRFNIKLNFIGGLVSCLVLANLFFMFAEPAIIKRGLSFNAGQTAIENGHKRELDNERLELWDKTYYMIAQNPLMGVGAGNWQIHFPDATLNGMWRAEDLNYTFQRPHNDLLWILSETGYLGLNLFLLFVVSILLLLLQTMRGLSNTKQWLEPALCFISIIGFFTISFFDFPKERIEHLVWINLILGLAYCLITEHIELKTIVNIGSAKPLLLAGMALSVFAVVIGAYRYQGELHTRKLYDQKARNNIGAVIKEGEKAMSFVYSIDPVSLPVQWYTGNAYALGGNYARAKSEFIAALKLNPYNRNVLNDLGSAYVVTQQTDSAYYYYREACRISPRFDDAKLNLAVVYFNQKQFEKADSCLKTLLHDSERRTQYQKLVDAYLGRKAE